MYVEKVMMRCRKRMIKSSILFIIVELLATVAKLQPGYVIIAGIVWLLYFGHAYLVYKISWAVVDSTSKRLGVPKEDVDEAIYRFNMNEELPINKWKQPWFNHRLAQCKEIETIQKDFIKIFIENLLK